MTRSDDNSSSTITPSINFPFFGVNYSAFWVNVNGGISFRTPISTFTPSCQLLNATYSMVAPFWADVDISMTGEIYYRQSTDTSLLIKAQNEITHAFTNLTSINISWVFIVTWYNVTYYPDNLPDYYYRKRDTFQAILATNGAQAFAIFYYNNITWTTGDASGGTNGLGGTPAFAGFDAGDGVHRYVITGSCNSSIINLASETNIGKPGVWVFQIDDYTIITPPPPSPTPPASTISPGQLTSVPISTVITTTTQPGPSTTPGSTTSLSNSDGTPCNCNNSGLWLDLLLVIDRSAGVGVDGLTEIAGQLAAALNNVPIAQKAQNDFYTRVGLIVYSSDVQVIGDLTHYTNSDGLIGDLFSLTQYYKPSDRIADIGKALKTAQTIFQTQSLNRTLRNVPKAVVLYASSYNKINDDPVTIASQMNNSNIFIITINYHDNSGVATDLLNQISTPYMNFSSNANDAVAEVSQGLCYANCLCPFGSYQLKTLNTTSYQQTYYADCLQPIGAGTFPKFAEKVCEARNGTLVSLTSQAKTDFMFNVAVYGTDKTVSSSNSLHIGLHRNTQNQWAWYGYDHTEYPLGNFQPWAPGFNNNSAGDAVYIDKLGPGNWQWMTGSSGSNPFQYICQIRACDSAPTNCDRSGWLNNGQ
uniref:Uncharacterized protein n=1 Tax=Acrobeloides nanus TaxID=290746 RepID=A0A914CP32_9BILA